MEYQTLAGIAPNKMSVGNARSSAELGINVGIHVGRNSLIVERESSIDIYDCYYIGMDTIDAFGFITCDVHEAIRLEIPDPEDIIEFLSMAKSYDEVSVTPIHNSVKTIDMSDIEAIRKLDFWIIDTCPSQNIEAIIANVFKYLT